jgi:hypothetical protein
MLLLRVMNHQANSTSPQRLKPPLLVLRSHLPRHSPLDFTMKRESVPHGGTSQQSFVMISVKPNGQIKTRVRATESHPFQQPARHETPSGSSPNEPSETRYSTQIDGDGHPKDLHLGIGTLGPPPLFKAKLAASTPPNGTLMDLPRRSQPKTMANNEKGGGRAKVNLHLIRPYHTVNKIWAGGTGYPPRSDLGFIQHHSPQLRLHHRSWHRQRSRLPPPHRRTIAALVADQRLANFCKTPLMARETAIATTRVGGSGGEGSQRR